MIPKHVHNFGTYFVTTQTWGRRALFQADDLAHLLVETLLHYRNENQYLLHEFVIMPNHLHVIITPTDITVERAMQLIKGGFSFRVRQAGRKNLEIWQPGFTDHRIRDASDYEARREYIYLNPVHAKLCEEPSQYRWCSASPEFLLDPVPQRLKPIELAARRHG